MFYLPALLQTKHPNFSLQFRHSLVKLISMKSKRLLAHILFFLFTLPGTKPANATTQLAPEPILISATPAGEPGGGWSTLPAISADGRVIAFVSTAADLVPRDYNSKADIFIHDRLEGVTRRVSINSQGVEANGWSYRFALSGDGRMVAFTSVATNLTPDDHNGSADIFIHDRLTGQTELISSGTHGVPANGWSDWPDISSDGRFVTFSSAASDLVYGDTNNQVDTFLHDRLTDQTRRVSVDSAGFQRNAPSGWESAISGDGRWVAFASTASFDPLDANSVADIYLHNRINFETIFLPTPWSDLEGYQGSETPKLSFDGSYLTLTARKAVSPDLYSSSLFVFNIASVNGVATPKMVTSTTVEDSDLQGVISANGAFLGTRWASAVRDGTQTNKLQVEDLDTGVVEIIALEIRKNNHGTGQVNPPALSYDAKQIAFSMLADHPSGLTASQIYLSAQDGEDRPDFFMGGQVTDKSGAPLKNVTVSLNHRRRVRTGPQGYFFFSGLSPGTQTIYLEKEGYLFRPESYQVQLAGDRRDLIFEANSEDLLEEARADIGMPYSFHRGCESPLLGCDGEYHGFHAGYCTDLVLDAYKFGVDFNIQWALERDALAHPNHFYRWQNARNSQDMWRYFHYTGQMLSNTAPYLPGDILFFDWDNDAVMDHVSMVSEVNAAGTPTRMIDATGKIDYNPSGLAAELAWERFHHETVRGHARWQGSYGASLNATPADLSVLHIAVDSSEIEGRVLDAGGAQLVGKTLTDPAAPAATRLIRGGHVYEMENGVVFSLISPLQNGDLYVLELTSPRATVYYLHFQITLGGIATQFEGSSKQTIAAGERHTFLIKVQDFDGTPQFFVRR
jgi:Tol biopolymer transport system component